MVHRTLALLNTVAIAPLGCTSSTPSYGSITKVETGTTFVHPHGVILMRGDGVEHTVYASSDGRFSMLVDDGRVSVRGVGHGTIKQGDHVLLNHHGQLFVNGEQRHPTGH